MKKLREIMRRLLKGQRGFTLIELLVAVGIMAILAGVAVPMVVKFTGTSQTKSAAAELSNVQVAVDAMMVDQELGDLSDCFTLASSTDDMSAFPCSGLTDTDVLYPEYTRQATTTGTYSAALDGTVTQNSTGY